MRWIHPLSGQIDCPAAPASLDLVGGKAHGLLTLRQLGLPVPPGFVVTTEACREFLRTGRLPEGLRDELAAATSELEAATGLRFGGSPPLTVSVRSGAPVSMPGMMNTILDLGLGTEATAELAAVTGDAAFAQASRQRFLSSFESAIADVPERHDQPIPDDPAEQLRLAVATVFASWDTRRARTFRELHEIPHDLGTAAIVQAMVFGNRDPHSGTGIAFSHNPDTGEHAPFGEVLFQHQGEDVVSGRASTEPLNVLAEREPTVWADLLDALRRVERHCRDTCYLEFTFQSGELWILQLRSGGFVGSAAVRAATELADEGVISRREALSRVSVQDLERVRTPRIAASDMHEVLARGIGACPGVAVGRVATTTDAAVRMAADGPVLLVRPETSPHDMHGLAVAAGILTTRGGPASHAAVVARSLGKPAVVGAAAVTVDPDKAEVSIAGRTVGEGALLTIDGTNGAVVVGAAAVSTNVAGTHLHRLLRWADEVSEDDSERDEARRLAAAHAALATKADQATGADHADRTEHADPTEPPSGKR